MDDSMIMPPTPEKDEVPDVKVEHNSDETLKKKSSQLRNRFENKIKPKIDTDDQPCFGNAVSAKSPNSHKNSKVITLNEITEFRGLKDRKMLYKKYKERDPGYKFHLDAISALRGEFEDSETGKPRSRTNSSSKILRQNSLKNMTISGKKRMSVGSGEDLESNKRIKPSLRSRGELVSESSSEEESSENRNGSFGSKVENRVKNRSKSVERSVERSDNNYIRKKPDQNHRNSDLFISRRTYQSRSEKIIKLYSDDFRRKTLEELMVFKNFAYRYDFVDDAFHVMQSSIKYLEKNPEKAKKLTESKSAESGDNSKSHEKTKRDSRVKSKSRSPDTVRTSLRTSKSRDSDSNTSSKPSTKSSSKPSSNPSSKPSSKHTSKTSNNTIYHQSIDMTSFRINKQFFLEIYEQLDTCSTILDRVQKQSFTAPYFKDNPKIAKTHKNHTALLQNVKPLALLQIKSIIDRIAYNSTEFFKKADSGEKELKNINEIIIAKWLISVQARAGLEDSRCKSVLLSDWCRMLDAVKRCKRFGKLAGLEGSMDESMMGFLNQMISAVIDYKTKSFK